MNTIRKEVFEIFEEYKKADTRDERLDVLKKYSENWALRDILRGTFDDSLTFNLPEGRPPFTPNKPESVPSTLLKRHREVGMYVSGGRGDSLPAYKRENKFVQSNKPPHNCSTHRAGGRTVRIENIYQRRR